MNYFLINGYNLIKEKKKIQLFISYYLLLIIGYQDYEYYKFIISVNYRGLEEASIRNGKFGEVLNLIWEITEELRNEIIKEMIRKYVLEIKNMK